MGSLPGVVCELCNRWFPNAQVYGGHKSRRTPCQGLSAVARPSRSAPSAGLHALLFVHDILSDAPAAPATPTASNASNAIGESGPPSVPEAHIDENPTAVNEGAPEDEHQHQPGTPAADKSGHPERRPEGNNAAPPTISSGQSNATPLNPLALKLLHFVRRANGGMGMAEVDINGLLQLVVEPGLAPLVTSELRNCKDLERFELERLAGLNCGWSVATFEIAGHPPQRLLFQNSAQVSRLLILGCEMLMWQTGLACIVLTILPLSPPLTMPLLSPAFTTVHQAFAEMFRHPNDVPGFKLKARVDEDPDTGDRRYTTPETGTWWNDAQVRKYLVATPIPILAHASIDALMCLEHLECLTVCPLPLCHALQEHFGWSEVVGGIILYSDVTHMSNNGRKKAWPLMMTLANIAQDKRRGEARHTLLALLPIPPSAMSAVEKVMLFQRCVITVLQPLLDGIASGFRLRDPFGDWQTVWPLLYAWVCDYPESGKISCTLSHGLRMPRSICYAAKEHLGAVKARNTPRTPEQQQWIVNEAAGTINSQDNPCKTYSTYPIECVLWKWDVPGTVWGNPYLVVMPDIMHQADLGIMSHIVAVVRKMKKRRVKQMDRSVLDGGWIRCSRRLSLIRDRTRLNHMRLPESTYFETGACVAAYEHRAVMQSAHAATSFSLLLTPSALTLSCAAIYEPCRSWCVFFAGLLRQPQMDAVRAYLGWYLLCSQPQGHTERSLRELKKMTSRLVEQLQAAFPKQPSSWWLVKTHLMSHYIDSIRRAGHVTEFSTNMFEHLHGPLVKRIYRRSNKRNVDGQIMKFHARRIPDVVPVDDPAGRDTAMWQAIETDTPTHSMWSYQKPPPLPTGLQGRAKQHPGAQAALKDALIRSAGCVTKVRAYASLAIPAADDASFSRVSHFVRATPDYFERSWYSMLQWRV
ncbi:unnamed protein product [Closterium sp. Yama58-4]|nr:unnamed protein product [Closterium sp. Yama58-4]